MIADGTVATADLANQAVSSGKLADTSVTTAKLSPSGGSTGKVLKHNGSAVVWGDDAEGGLTLPFSGSGTTTGAFSAVFHVESSSGEGPAVSGTSLEGTGVFGKSDSFRGV